MINLFQDLRDDPDFYEEFLEFYEGDSPQSYFQHHFEEFLNKVRKIQTSADGIFCWRAINAKSLQDLDLNQIGASWSYSKDKAHSWYGGEGESFIVEALIPTTEIDLETTLRQNLVNPDENEIRLEGHSFILILKIYNADGEIVKEFKEPLKSSSGKIGVFGDWQG